jgi:hypothetical protein
MPLHSLNQIQFLQKKTAASQLWICIKKAPVWPGLSVVYLWLRGV